MKPTPTVSRRASSCKIPPFRARLVLFLVLLGSYIFVMKLLIDNTMDKMSLQPATDIRLDKDGIRIHFIRPFGLSFIIPAFATEDDEGTPFIILSGYGGENSLITRSMYWHEKCHIKYWKSQLPYLLEELSCWPDALNLKEIQWAD